MIRLFIASLFLFIGGCATPNYHVPLTAFAIREVQNGNRIRYFYPNAVVTLEYVPGSTHNPTVVPILTVEPIGRD